MGLYQFAAWGVVFGLAFILVGGLILWAYGARRVVGLVQISGPEAVATRLFHTRLVRWFFLFGMGIITMGATFLLWSGSILFF